MKVDKEALIVNIFVLLLAVGLIVGFCYWVEPVEKESNYKYLYEDVENFNEKL